MASEPCLREIEELKKSNIELTHAMNHLNVELETMSNRLVIITDEKEELRRHKDLRIGELQEELRGKIHELEACIRENAGLESQNKSLASQVDILSKENGSLSIKIKRLDDEVADSKAENKRLNDELQRDYDHLNRLTKAIKEEVEKLEREKLMEKREEEISHLDIGGSKAKSKGKCQTSEQPIDLMLEDLMGKYKIIHNKLQLHCDKLERDYDELKHSLEEQKGGVDIIEEEETNIQPLFGCLNPKNASYIDAAVAFLAFGVESYLISLGEGDVYKKKRLIANILGFSLAIMSTVSTSFAILVEAKFHGVGWNQRWFYKEGKPYIPLLPIGELIVTLGSLFLFGNTIPLWTAIQLKPGVHDFCFGISTLCFFFKFLKAVIARVLRRWWWTGAD